MLQNFTNEPIDLNQLPKYQEVELTPLHPNYWKVIVINIVITLLVIGALLVSLVLFVDDFQVKTYIVCIAYFSFAAFLFLIFKASFKKRGYALREKDMLYKSGIIAEKTTIVPLNRIQHVALDEGVFSRIFKLGKIQIYTAGGQTGHLHIAGIPIDKAKSIKEILLKRLDQLEDLTAETI